MWCFHTQGFVTHLNNKISDVVKNVFDKAFLQRLTYTVALRITLVVYYPRQMAAILPSIQKVFAVPRQHLTII